MIPKDSKVIGFPPRSLARFGVCPICRKSDGWFNQGPVHWFFCHAHKYRWIGGEAEIGGWQADDQLDLLVNVIRMEGYRRIGRVVLSNDDLGDGAA